jgi:hypothetical protein
MSKKNDAQDESESKAVNRRQFLTRTALGVGAVALTTAIEGCGTSSSSSATQPITSNAWKFGVMSDTQWTTPPNDDGYDPNSSAVSIATQLQQQFINNGVKFVVHVGDLCDNSTIAGEDTRALYAQSLYNAGIGFFPLRGNHDDSAALGAEFARLYPQTGNVAANAGTNNNTPSDILTTFATSDKQVTGDNLPVPTKSGSTFPLGSNFSSPNPYGNSNLNGLSYSFDFNNARFILLDQFTPLAVTAPSNQTFLEATSGTQLGTIALQQPWISSQLSGRPSASHAFVFAHKGLITCNHADILFGNDPSQDPTSTDAFINSLVTNKAGYYINGHDHMCDRSLVSTTDGNIATSVMQILCASDSSKFYVPAGQGTNTPTVNGTVQKQSNDLFYNVSIAGKKARRTPVTQELYTVGYYIFTVDGANVTVDYYSADVYPYYSSGSEMIVSTAPGLTFTKQETFGYSLVGQRFVVPQGQPYSVVQDTSSTGTTAKILSGTNNSTARDANGTPFAKVVNTGWISAGGGAKSDILTLWGLDPYIGSTQPDTYVLSMTSKTAVTATSRLAVLTAAGTFTNAVNQNSGGTPAPVTGPWSASGNYPLGTYGVDTTSNTVWAVLNYNGRFAIVPNV